MDSAKIFALGLAAGLAIHVFVRNSAKAQSAKKEVPESISAASKSTKKNKNKKKAKDNTPAPAAPASEKKPEPVKEPEPAPAPVAVVANEEPAAPTTASKKNKKKNKAVNKEEGESHAAVTAEDANEPKINNTAIRAKADATQTAFTSSFGDMRDDEVDPLPAGYDSVARIPAPEVEAPKPKLSQKERDEGWSSVRSGAPATNGAKLNGTSSSKPNGAANGVRASIASNNPFAALPDDAPTSSVKRLPASTSSTSKSSATANGWTVASASSKPKNKSVVGAAAAEAETKKQRSNANKAQAKKAAKEEADRLQAQRLANHRRQQALEATKQKEAARRPQPSSVNVGSAKAPTAKASVDLNGRLVWD
ncbi:hypothetical protein NDA16_005062 [Ustilago loliicola]|nr:hypothetical protein NDA16_005062 [Ustilago loliicola]